MSRWGRRSLAVALAAAGATAAWARARHRAAVPPSRTSRPLGGRDVRLGAERDAEGVVEVVETEAEAQTEAEAEVEVVEAPDDRDTAGGGLPVPADQAALELREENRFESAVFVRSIVILVAIAVLLTARTIWVG